MQGLRPAAPRAGASGKLLFGQFLILVHPLEGFHLALVHLLEGDELRHRISIGRIQGLTALGIAGCRLGLPAQEKQIGEPVRLGPLLLELEGEPGGIQAGPGGGGRGNLRLGGPTAPRRAAMLPRSRCHHRHDEDRHGLARRFFSS